MKKDPVTIHQIYGLFFAYFRKRRMEKFIETLRPTSRTKILDVGGTPYNWIIIKSSSKVTLLNFSFSDDEQINSENFIFERGNRTNLQYADAEFDVCYSNSVIEHLSSLENQMLFAQETRRVGRQIWVQTPAKSFFVEPHLITPFIHYLPKKIQEKLLRNFSILGLITRPSQEKVKVFLEEVRLLIYDEMAQLFPDCEIYIERFLDFAKAYIAVRV